MVAIPIPRAETANRFKGQLRTPNLLARYPLIGVMMVVLGSLIFAYLAYNVHVQGALYHWDLTITNHMHTLALNSPNWMKDIAFAGYYVGLHGYIVIGIMLGLYFLYKRFWKELLMVVFGCAGQGAFWLLLANYFDRNRPEFDTPIGSALHYPSFPSGHTMSGVVGFGLLAYLLVPKISSLVGKTAVIIISLVMMFFIGFSRFFMGAHYPTDILAGFAAGIFWAGFVFTILELLFVKGGK